MGFQASGPGFKICGLRFSVRLCRVRILRSN